MPMRGFASRARPSVADVGRALAVLSVCVGVTLLLDDQLATTPRGFDVPWVALTAAACLPVAFARNTPFAAAAAALGLSLLGMLLGYPMTAPIIVALALVAVAASRAEVRLTGTLGVLSGGVIAVVALSRADHDQWIAALGGLAVGMLPALAGEKLRAERVRARDARELARRAEELRDSDIQRAVTEERLRIARDVHDITGHHLSAIALQAGGASLTTQDPTASAALRRIHELAHETLGQTRRALGALRDDDAPAALSPLPRLADVDQLLATARATGAAPELRVEGKVQELPESIEVCAYRVIQESLTNVVRHAHAGAVQVLINYDAGLLTVTVDDDGVGAPRTGGGPVRTGGGLVGMRERLALVGGSLAAGPRDGGGWSVRATLPLGLSA
jgi:signal transduction histidine kinase